MSKVANILGFGSRPERDVLRVERVLFGVIDHGCLLKFLPMDSIGGNECNKPGLDRSREGFEFVLCRCVWVFVEEGSEVMAVGGFVEDDIVVFVSIEFDDTQRRFCPMDPVAAFAVPRYFCDVTVEFRAAAISGIHAIDLTIPDDGSVFHRISGLLHWFCGFRLMQLEGESIERIDQIAIDKEFTAGADLQGFGIGLLGEEVV
jgi:hypothetical protein